MNSYIRPEIKQEWIDKAKEHGFDFALAFEHDNLDEPYDYIGNYETAQTMANEGYLIIVFDIDAKASYNIQTWQEIMDHERDLVIDCFGDSYLQ